MRDPNRIPVLLNEISRIWTEHPEFRLSQIIGNVLPSKFQNDSYYLEDDELLQLLKEVY